MEPDPSEWSGLPPALRALVEVERAAGNRVAAIDRGFPAPPVGFCVLLERDVSTRPADADDGLHYRQWPNWKGYHGYSDEPGHFFVLNPPLPPAPDPVMVWEEAGASAGGAPDPDPLSRPVPLQVAHLAPARDAGGSPLVRFRQSLDIDYEKWREGIGYNMAALDAMDRDERLVAEGLMLARGTQDWRDVEALARLDTPACRALLRRALAEGGAEIRLAVMRHAPALLTPATRTATLVAALATAAPYDGLSQAIDQAVAWHPAEVIDALWRGLSEREGPVAVHYAALLTYLYGRADSLFDFDQRPLFLRFHADDPAHRADALAALRQHLAGAVPFPSIDLPS